MEGSEIFRLIREKFPEAVLEQHDFRGDNTLVMDRSVLHEVMTFVRDEQALRFDYLVDVCGADYLGKKPVRFEVVYHLRSMTHHHRLRLRFPVPEEDPIVPSVVDLWVTADWYEREAFDMFGIRFLNHPNLRRILMHEHFEGYPLRKDYPVNRRYKLLAPVDDILTPKPCKG
jgi:NADH/F420H2 dehydrogenase subunit C